jgi:hypothetical protein
LHELCDGFHISIKYGGHRHFSTKSTDFAHKFLRETDSFGGAILDLRSPILVLVAHDDYRSAVYSDSTQKQVSAELCDFDQRPWTHRSGPQYGVVSQCRKAHSKIIKESD